MDDYTDADYIDSYGDNYAANETAYDVADNGATETSSSGTTVSRPSWLDSLQKGAGFLVDTAIKVAPAAFELIGSGKGTPILAAQPATSRNGAYPETGGPGTTSKTNFTPWLIGGAVALGLAVIGFIFLRKK